MLGAGCNVMSLPYFLSMGDDRLPPQLMKLSSDDKEVETRVAVMTYAGTVTEPEFVGADRELTGMLCQYLQREFQENKEKVVLVPAAQVNRYKDNHPNWHLDLEETAKRFRVDYLVYLDVESLSLYEPRSFNQFYRGRADVHVSVVDAHKPDDYPAKKDFHCEFPAGAPVQVEDRNPQEFRRTFLNYVAEHISWYFTAHPPAHEIGVRE